MKVLLVAAGGTIASRPSDEGVKVALKGAELLERAGIDEASVDVLDLGQGPSWGFSPAAVERIARTSVETAARGAYDGVVVTHGTDTVEESAFLTWLLGGAAASERCSIVFTAAMRHADHPDTDGPANLRDAVDLAAAGGASGPVVRIGGVTHHARWARKRDTSDLDTFESVGAGAGTPDAPPPPPPHGEAIEPAVAEVHSHTGVDPTLVDHLVEWGARGLVVVGTGAGNVHGDFVPGIERAMAAGVPVVVTSRCWTGAVSPEYGGPGGGWSLHWAGCVLAGDLPTNKARLALSVAMGVDPAPDAVRAWFQALLEAGD
jgi:L-asparaginase